MAGTGKSARKGNTARKKGRSSTASRSRKNTASGKRGRKTSSVIEPVYSRSVHLEIKMIINVAISALMLLSVFGLCGQLGIYLGYFLFGIFGILAYAVPFVYLFGSTFILANPGNRRARFKMTAVLIFMIMVLSLITVSTVDFQAVNTISDSYYECGAAHTGGGLLGFLLTYPLTRAIGKIGTTVVFICVLMISFVMITGRGIFVRFGRYLNRKMDESRERAEQRREERAIRMQEEEEENERLREEERQRRRQERALARQQRREKKAAQTQKQSETESARTVPSKEKKPAAAAGKATVTSENVSDVLENIKAELDKPEFPDSISDAEKTDNTPITAEETGKINIHIGGETQEAVISHAEPSEETSGETAAQSGAAESMEEAARLAEAAERKRNRTDDIKIPSFMTRKNTGRPAHQQVRTRADSNEFHVPDLSAGRKPMPVNPSEKKEEEDRSGEEITLQEAIARNRDLEQAKSNTAPLPEEETSAESDAAKTMHVEKAQNTSLPEAESVPEEAEPVHKYEFPPMELLERSNGQSQTSVDALRRTAQKLQETFDSFGVGVTVTDVCKGPTVTRFELEPDKGVKVSKIVSLSDDIKLNLAVPDIRIEAPVPGKNVVGIEVPNSRKEMVLLGDLLDSPQAQAMESKIAFAVGKDIAGQTIMADIDKMPHLLIAGATGSGKSVCINTIIVSILYRADPSEVKLIMIDPKVVELSGYNGIPHLLIPVVTDPKEAAGALNWAVSEMMSRYRKFAAVGAKKLSTYNAKIDRLTNPDEEHKKMPQIVIIIDELADLMMTAQGDVETAINRIAQLGRAAGLHLIVATQRPSVNVITGNIKANIPSRIAFAVSSGVDSRTILEKGGAERLLGNGDMLYSPQDYNRPVRVQGAFISEKEIGRVTEFIKAQNIAADTDSGKIAKEIETSRNAISNKSAGVNNERDVYFEEAGRFVIEKEKASIGMLQRVYKIGFNRAARIMDQLCDAGVVGPDIGTKPRQILMTIEEFEDYLNSQS